MGVYHHLSAAERTHIARRMQAGVRLAQIALELGRHKSTLYRECQRNRCDKRPYQAGTAHTQAQHLARRARPIAQRPAAANARTQFGHWEADLLSWAANITAPQCWCSRSAPAA
jgi:IS30 family transposase